MFWVEAEDLGGDLVSLESTGLLGSGRATLSVVVERGVENVAGLGIFSEEAFTVPAGTVIDAYDSSKGTYAEQAAVSDPDLRVNGDVGSNASITVEATESQPTTVGGNVIPGESGSVVTQGTPTITGVTEPRPTNAVLPPVAVPVMEEVKAGVDHSGAATAQIAAGDYAMPFLRVGAGGDAVLLGPANVVLGELRLASGATLLLDPTDGAIQLFVTGDLELASGSALTTTTDDPALVAIRVPDDTLLVLESAGAFHGSLYAPLAEARIGADFELFGSIVARHLVLLPQALLHFDHHLAVIGAEGTLPQQVSWWIEDFAPLDASAGVLDPFDVLGVDEDLLRKPADAHEDQTIDILYLDMSGAVRTYTGDESAFDWTDVKEAITFSRDGESTALTSKGGKLFTVR